MEITVASLITLLMQSVKGIDLSGIDNDKSFSDLGIDSLDQASFLMAIDEAFGINIPDSDVDKCYSIESTLHYLKSAKRA